MRTREVGSRLVAAVCVLALGWCLVGGCPPQQPPATFTAGTTATDVGTIDNGQGTTFDLSNLPDGFGVTSSGAEGDATFEVDEQGRLTHLEHAGATLDFVYNPDGTVNVSGTVTVGGQQVAINEVADAGEIPTAKPLARSAEKGNICRAIDFFCTNLEAILLYVEAALLNEAGWQENPESDPLITIANLAIETAVAQTIDQITGPLQSFCEVWSEIRGELGDICN